MISFWRKMQSLSCERWMFVLCLELTRSSIKKPQMLLNTYIYYISRWKEHQFKPSACSLSLISIWMGDQLLTKRLILFNLMISRQSSQTVIRNSLRKLWSVVLSKKWKYIWKNKKYLKKRYKNLFCKSERNLESATLCFGSRDSRLFLHNRMGKSKW